MQTPWDRFTERWRKHLDYISPMIYPSHYSDGNYGIDHPDMRPYDTICAALTESRKELYFAGLNGDHVAEVRPWLQDFTASWLKNHIPYGGEQVRDQIRAVYDCGYNEWLCGMQHALMTGMDS